VPRGRATAPLLLLAGAVTSTWRGRLRPLLGLTLAAAKKADEAVFQPGYRWDALVVFPEAGNYCVINDLEASSASVNQNERGVQILGFVHVGAGDAAAGDPSAFLAGRLEAAAEANMPAAVPNTSTLALTNATFPYVLKIARLGANAAISEDKGIAEGVNTFNGVLTYGAVAAAQRRDWQAVAKLV